MGGGGSVRSESSVKEAAEADIGVEVTNGREDDEECWTCCVRGADDCSILLVRNVTRACEALRRVRYLWTQMLYRTQGSHSAADCFTLRTSYWRKA